ncbi:MAG: polysaccharide biosynthesis C-terminal domain-containing protein, partial [Lachnospiraceae bacterium]|nr:polysaccharide biosynthesis C-terminal domain-containing protein [Lachnospiraceae bacterium]
LMVLAGPIIRLLYPGDNGLASELLILGGVAVAFFSLSTVTNAILQGINKMRVPVRNALIALLIHVGVLFLLLYGLNMGIYGVVIANMLFGLTMCMLNSACISDYLQYRQEIKKTFVLPSVASAIMGVAAWGVYQLGYRLFSSNAFATILAIVIAVAVYGVLLLLLKCVDEVELYDFPMGGRLAKLAKKMHLLK